MPAIRTPTGVELHYRVSGTGPVNLICLHGWGGSGDSWNKFIKHLDGTRYRVICPDLRGHGKSGCPVGSCAWGNFALDVLAIADHEQARRFVPVGFSMGGKLACYLAAKFANRISTQILVAPAPPGVVPIDRDAGLQICREAGDWRQNKKVFQNWFAPSAKEELIEACSRTVAQTPRWVLEATAKMTLWTSLTAAVGRLELPSLLVTGKHDPIYNAGLQKEHMLPHLGYVTNIAVQSGHFIPIECPGKLAQLANAFVLEYSRFD